MTFLIDQSMPKVRIVLNIQRAAISQHLAQAVTTRVLFLFLLLAPRASLLHDNRLLAAQDCAGATNGARLEVPAVVSLKQRATDRLDSLA